MQVDIGLKEGDRKKVCDALANVLADTYIFYMKTQNFHWNVTGPRFISLHAMFEEQYIDLRTAADEIAERIRALGEFAPGSYKRYSQITKITEADNVPPAEEMVSQLQQGHETLSKRCEEALRAAAAAGDDVSVDLMTQRMAVHQKTAWMLRSLNA